MITKRNNSTDIYLAHHMMVPKLYTTHSYSACHLNWSIDLFQPRLMYRPSTITLLYQLNSSSRNGEQLIHKPLVMFAFNTSSIPPIAFHLIIQKFKRRTWNKISHNKSYASNMAVNRSKMQRCSPTKIIRSSNLNKQKYYTKQPRHITYVRYP